MSSVPLPEDKLSSCIAFSFFVFFVHRVLQQGAFSSYFFLLVVPIGLFSPHELL